MPGCHGDHEWPTDVLHLARHTASIILGLTPSVRGVTGFLCPWASPAGNPLKDAPMTAFANHTPGVELLQYRKTIAEADFWKH